MKTIFNVNLVSARKIVGEIRRVFSFWWELPLLTVWTSPPHPQSKTRGGALARPYDLLGLLGNATSVI